MANYSSFTGTISRIDNFGAVNSPQIGCTQIMEVVDNTGNVVDFIVSPTTYVLDQFMLQPGDQIIGFYDSNLPVPLIYPPQFQAAVIALVNSFQSITVSYFNSRLLNSDGTLRLNLSSNTMITLTNGQTFIGFPGNRNLVVLYRSTTRSIPAQTTPDRIIVLCQ